MPTIMKDTFHAIFGPGMTHARETTFTPLADKDVLVALCKTFRPYIIVELGCNEGDTAVAILDEYPVAGRYIGVDVTPDFLTPEGKRPNESVPNPGHLVPSYQQFELRLLPHGTADMDTDPFFTSMFGKVDFVFIDANHTEPFVRHDTALARKLLRSGGVCAWHDYREPYEHDVVAVIDELNRTEGNRIVVVDGTMMAFEIRQ